MPGGKLGGRRVERWRRARARQARAQVVGEARTATEAREDTSTILYKLYEGGGITLTAYRHEQLITRYTFTQFIETSVVCYSYFEAHFCKGRFTL